jgi:hypothetical protein
MNQTHKSKPTAMMGSSPVRIITTPIARLTYSVPRFVPLPTLSRATTPLLVAAFRIARWTADTSIERSPDCSFCGARSRS